MASIGGDLSWLQGASQEVLKNLTPQTYADAAALAVVAVGSAAFTLRKYTWDRPDPYNYIWYERPQSGDGASAAKATRNIAQRLEELVSPDAHSIHLD